MDDRAGGANPRWVMVPSGGSLYFYNTTSGNVVSIGGAGKLSAVGGFSGQCLSAGNFNGTAANACNMDFAEAFASAERTQPGDLVRLVAQTNSTPTVRKANRAYDELLIGVVSQNPGLVFDNGQTHLAGDNSQLITDDKTVVALVGRVLANVTMENGPIVVGDPLTSASIPGATMKATRAGKIIGYALQAAERDGQALVLLQPGTWLPADVLAAQTENAQLKARVASLEEQNAATDARLAAIEQKLKNGGAPTLASALPLAPPATSFTSRMARAGDNFVPEWLIAGAIMLVGMMLTRRFGFGGKK